MGKTVIKYKSLPRGYQSVRKNQSSSLVTSSHLG